MTCLWRRSRCGWGSCLPLEVPLPNDGIGELQCGMRKWLDWLGCGYEAIVRIAVAVAVAVAIKLVADHVEFVGGSHSIFGFLDNLLGCDWDFF